MRVTAMVSWMPPRWLAWTFAGLAAAAIGYGLWWRHAAGLLETTLTDFRVQAPSHGAQAGWDALETSGFPLRLRAKLDNPRYANMGAGLAWEARGLTLEMLPWSVAQFNFAAEGKQMLTLGPALRIAGEAKESGLSLLFRSDGMPKQVDVAATTADAVIQQAGAADIGVKGATLAFHWRIDPQDQDAKDGRDYDAALNGANLTVTGVDLPFGPDIGDLRLQVSLRGVPALKGIDGAMDLVGWRQRGAPLSVRKLSFVSGGVDVEGGGDLALGADGVLQGQLNLTVGGLDKIVALLSKKGAVPAEAKSTLFVTSTMLAATGAKVPMPLAFKDGKTYLGPVQIGPAPRLVF